MDASDDRQARVCSELSCRRTRLQVDGEPAREAKSGHRTRTEPERSF
jgi:hypothetical protein